MSDSTKLLLTRPPLVALVAIALSFCIPAVAQSSDGTGATAGYATSQSSAAASGFAGSVPTGTATNEVLKLTLRDAITQGVRYNLAAIESGENARIARGQRLLALSGLLPQISVGASENLQQISLATLGIKNLPGVPNVVGPFGYSSVDGNLSQTLFSFESIQPFSCRSHS